jgi:hypothetical protein
VRPVVGMAFEKGRGRLVVGKWANGEAWWRGSGIPWDILEVLFVRLGRGFPDVSFDSVAGFV